MEILKLIVAVIYVAGFMLFQILFAVITHGILKSFFN